VLIPKARWPEPTRRSIPTFNPRVGVFTGNRSTS
jgi:hypothetical protein